MIYEIAKEKKTIVVIFLVSIGLFLFCYLFLKDDVMYSIAGAFIPWPFFCVYDRICALRNLRSYSKGDRTLLRSVINYIVLAAIIFSCLYQLSGAYLMAAVIGTAIYSAVYFSVSYFEIKKVKD